MPPKAQCKLEPQYDKDRGLRKGQCACGKVFYSVSLNPRRCKDALRTMEIQYRQHWVERNGDPVL
jgi:hypothetical protein